MYEHVFISSGRDYRFPLSHFYLSQSLIRSCLVVRFDHLAREIHSHNFVHINDINQMSKQKQSYLQFATIATRIMIGNDTSMRVEGQARGMFLCSVYLKSLTCDDSSYLPINHIFSFILLFNFLALNRPIGADCSNFLVSPDLQ